MHVIGVGYGEFLSFIMVAMGKVEEDEVEEIHTLFKSLDVDDNGFLEKSDILKLTTGERSEAMQLTDSIRRMGANQAAAQRR